MGYPAVTMARDFEEIDYRQTRLGELILRRRVFRMLDNLEVYEVILADAFLMSSMFTAVEVALSDLGLAGFEKTADLQVVVGGLGLGYTAKAALAHENVGAVLVVETLEPVIEWHQKALVPLGAELHSDSRCRFVHGDFFELTKTGFDPDSPGRTFDAVLLDIDHTPSKLLDPAHAALYSREGLSQLSQRIKPNGVFAMWSDDPPDKVFMNHLREVFDTTESHVVSFENPLQGGESSSSVYVAKK